MLLSNANLAHLNSVTHEGKVVIMATDPQGKLLYTIRQDGFEDSYGNTAVTGWENWQALPLSQEADDPSILEQEQETLTYPDDADAQRYILRSQFNTADQTAVAPVQLVSGLGHLYVFRQSKTGTLLVDRFVLDGLTNTLVRKLDVRFKRSRQKYAPLENPNGSRSQTFDALDYRDANNQPFYEPTTELSLIQNLEQGWFDVVLLPTTEPEKYRWHIFAYNAQSQAVELTSIRASAAGLFEIKDDTVFEPKPGEPSILIPRSIPGIIHRTLDLRNSEDLPLSVSNGLTATTYDLQEERETQVGPQLLKTATKVMLAIPLQAGGVAALSFATAADGTLAQIDEQPQFQTLRSDARDVLLPLNTLDEIKGIGQGNSPPQGAIAGMERGENDQVRILSPQAQQLQYGDQVEIANTQHYNGHYIAHKIDDQTFEIETQWVAAEAGNWAVIPEAETGLIFDGIITAYEPTPDGKLRITSPNHGLESGDEVQVADTQDYNGTYAVTEIEPDRFSIDLPWHAGEAINLKLESRKRRGISFDGEQDYIEIPGLELKRPSTDYAYGQTYSVWVYVSDRSRRKQLCVSDQNSLMWLGMSNSRMMAQLAELGQVIDPDVLPENQWVHYASTFAYDPKTASTTLTLCRNGTAIATEVFDASPATLAPDAEWEPKFWLGGSDSDHYFAGKLADVQIWDQGRSPQDIKNSMYLQLTGREVGLAGYWRLGAIMADRERHVVDFSIHEKDGRVYGDAFVSAATLSRTLGDGTTPIVQYRNDELFAVSQRTTYEECFEFKLDDASLNPNDIDGNGTPLFAIAYWGQANRSTDDGIEFAGEQAALEPIAEGWYKATARFTVPDEVRLVRAFGLVDVTGEWQTLEIRKHRIRSISNAVTAAQYRDRLELHALTNQTPDAQLNELTAKELTEADLLVQKQKLEAEIALLDNVSALQAEVGRLEALLSRTASLRDNQLQAYRREVNNPFNYYCRLINQNSGRGIDVQNFSSANGARLGQYTPGNHYHQQWYFQPHGAFYIIVNRNSQKAMEIEGLSVGAAIVQNPLGYANRQQWSVVQQAGGTYQITNRSTNLAIDVQSFSKADGALLGQYARGSHTSQRWFIQPTSDQANDTIPKIHQRYQQYLADYQRITADLAAHRAMLANRTTELQRLRQLLETVTAKLVDVQTVLNQLNTAILESVQSNSQDAQTMDILHTDARGMVTQGALLDFIQSASRLTSLAGSEGNVQLNYFDQRGQMRQTKYDATADRLNAAYEQWLPDGLKACLNLQQADSKLLLEEPLQLTPEWTVETWFSYPLPKTNQWNTLLRGETPDHQVIVRNGKYLGTYIGNSPQKFFPAQYGMEGEEPMDFSLEALTPGWHHLAAVGTGEGDDARTVFYIDGQKVGEAHHKSTTNIIVVGNSTGNTQPFGKITEVRLWSLALSAAEVEVNSKTMLSGNEPGLVAYYPTNEATGTVIRDRSGNNRHAEAQSALWWACAAPIGNPGHTVMQFGNSENRITIPYRAAFKVTSALTLEAWIKPDRLDQTWQSIVQYPHAATHTSPFCDYSLVLSQSGGLHTRIDGVPTQTYGAGQVTPQSWHHVALTWDGATITFLINGEPVGSEATDVSQIQYAHNNPLLIGANASGTEAFAGRIAEVRLWNVARSPAEIQVTRHQHLTGSEANLVGYWPLDFVDNMATPATVKDMTGTQTGQVDQAVLVMDNMLPLSESALVVTEYSTIGIEPGTQQKAAIMRRLLGLPTRQGAKLFADQRVEMLELKWVGNAQFAPTLLGYIEGAPPVPSENLTEEDDYNGATSVELTVTDDLEFSWNRAQESGGGVSTEFFVGVGGTTSVGLGAEQEFEYKAGVKGELSSQRTDLNESNISTSVGLSMTDRLELRGSSEQSPQFLHLGQRYVPKNVGYALVVSGLADLYITRLKRSQRMIGYQLLPNPDLPFDVNTITFLMNPAYTMNGSLDGQTGTAAATDRFHRHVPEMRSQYGSLYPASYFRVQEAYDIEAQIEQQDKERESYFQNFNARAVEASALNSTIGPIELEPAPITVGSSDSAAQPQTEAERQAQEEQRRRQTQDQGAQNAEQVEQLADQRRAEIAARQESQEAKVQALAGIDSWQRKMEGLLVRAAKRNIVNTYVWDADGGLRAETQEFANAVEHTIGGSLVTEGGIGIAAEGSGGPAGELTVLATGTLSQTLTKTENRSRGFALNVDLGGVESRGITDNQDRPLLPGEKVDRYRFKSFYLEGHTNHFHDFFDTVVDPEWLQSNDEEARALRQTMAGHPNKTWRVLHRVTYVERPALLGLGRDLRRIAGNQDAEADLQAKIALLEENNLALATKLDDVLNLLRSQSLQTQLSSVPINGERVTG